MESNLSVGTNLQTSISPRVRGLNVGKNGTLATLVPLEAHIYVL